MKQIDRVLAKLRNEGVVSRNYYLDLPYGQKITRLGAIINRLKCRGYAIEGYEEGHDFKYKLTAMPDGKPPVKVLYEKIEKNGETIVVRKEVPITPPQTAKITF